MASRPRRPPVARSAPAPVAAVPSSAVPRLLGLTRSQIFSLLWLAGVVLWIFNSPAGTAHFPGWAATIIVLTTLYSLRRHPLSVGRRVHALVHPGSMRLARRLLLRTVSAMVMFAAIVVLSISGPARVVDGDTVVVAGTTVRLKGVDAAERGTKLGDAARQIMVDIIGNSELTCRLTGEKTWRREVGYCFTAAGIDINRAIIERGAALACARYTVRYLPFEQAAALAAQPRRAA
jgi:endonuclease YncB( thermonuclease family)